MVSVSVCWSGRWYFVFAAKKMKQTRRCEVTFAYEPANEDELKLEVGETLEILREVKPHTFKPLTAKQSCSGEMLWWLTVHLFICKAFTSCLLFSAQQLKPIILHLNQLTRMLFSQLLWILFCFCIQRSDSWFMKICRKWSDKLWEFIRDQTECLLFLESWLLLLLVLSMKCCLTFFIDVINSYSHSLQQIEDGWWMGMKNGKVGAFPSNFVREVFVSPKGW